MDIIIVMTFFLFCFVFFGRNWFCQRQHTLACTKTVCAVCALCHISVMVFFNSVQTDFSWMSCLFLPRHISFDMNSRNKLPQNGWTDLQECMLWVSHLPPTAVYFLHFLVVSLLIRLFSVTCSPSCSSPAPFPVLCLCFFDTAPSFPPFSLSHTCRAQ